MQINTALLRRCAEIHICSAIERWVHMCQFTRIPVDLDDWGISGDLGGKLENLLFLGNDANYF
jgi:hypothetical protein